jgi:hypothetical protein
LFVLSEELLVGSFEILQPVVIEIPDSGGYFIDHIVIVSYEQQGARTLKRDIDGVASAHWNPPLPSFAWRDKMTILSDILYN